MSQSPNSTLIGRTAEALSTPLLMIEAEALAANIRAMQAHCDRARISLRPHTKTHKCAEIARQQIAAGAKGICVAKLGEAEAMAAAGLSDILITSPVIGEPATARLVTLAESDAQIMIVVDAIEPARAISQALAARGLRIRALLDLDIGLARTGASPPTAVALAENVSRLPGLELVGIQAYAGHLQHIADADERRAKSSQALELVGEVRNQFRARGLCADIISGGGTGTFDIDPEFAVFSELQAGSYVFMDRQYVDVKLSNARVWPFTPSLFVLTRIISANHASHVTTDAGFKAFATDDGAPRIVSGAPDGASYFYYGDEQGGIALAPGAPAPALGSLVTCLTPHCDPTVNLYDVYHVFSGGRLKAIWPITARGCVA